jgi:hypothetical protein
MKSLLEFKTIVEEEKSDYSKFDILVRAGLANKAQLQRIHRILDKMQEERPQFNNADRMILQNLFNKMVDLITSNKQIFQKTRQAVREDVELNEAPIDGDPPPVLMLKRKSIRLYPDNTRVALYYNDKLDKYFSVPYGPKVDSAIQAEQVQESVMDSLHGIVNNKQANTVKFADGKTAKVDHFTASAIVQVHKALNDENKKKFADMVHKSKDHFARASDFAFRHTK